MFVNKYKINKDFDGIETHEVFLDKMAQIKEDEMGISEKRLEVKIKEKIIYAMFALFFLFAAFLFARTFYFQVFEGKELYAIAQSNKAKISSIIPKRGIIYDSNYIKLVSNAPAFDLLCDKRNYVASRDDFERQINSLAGIINKEPLEIEKLIESSQEVSVLVMESIPHETLLVLKTKAMDFPDCKIEEKTARNYAMGAVFSHILGYTSRVNKEDLLNFSNYSLTDYIGKTGLERYYEGYLRGTPGTFATIKNASGIVKSDQVVAEPVDGNNLVLHIESSLQKVAYESLEKSIKNINAKKGVAIALNPKNGAVLAMVSYPAYDNNIFSSPISVEDFSKIINNPYQPFFNRAIAAKYPTGSTIKPFLASGALQENIISPTKQIYDPGFIIVKSKYDPSVTYRFGGVTPHGWVDMREALAVSSNIYFYTIGGGYEDQKGLGPKGIKKYLSMYGWDSATGIDLPGEFSGFIPSPDWKQKVKNESWWDGDTYNLSIGQSDLQVTPLQVAVAYGAIANGGTLYKPQIVQKIISGSGEDALVVKEFNPEVILKIEIDPQNMEVVREGMLDGVQKDYGSSVMLRDLPVKVAGKTGTAETNTTGIYNTWSTSFAPYDDPEIVFVTTIEGVEGLRSATLPVAHDVLQYYFSKL